MDNARELGIAAFHSIEDSRQTLWRMARARLDLPAERPTPLSPDLADAGSRLNDAGEEMPERLRRILTAIVFGITLGFLLTGAYMVAPGATVHLSPAGNQVSVTTTITADPSLGPGDAPPTPHTIPARRVGVEVEAPITVETTGRVMVPSQKARGVVLFTNRIPDQVTVPAGTVLRTSAAQPVRFATMADVTLPGQVGETLQVPIEALEAGFVGNVPAGRVNTIEGPLSARLAVANPEPTEGGMADEVRAVSEQDMERARSLLLQQLQQRAYAEMQTGLLEDFEFVPPESLNVVLVHSETFSGYENQPADTLELAMRVTVQGVAVDRRLARQVVYGEMAQKIGPGFRIGPDSLLFREGEVTGIDDEGRVTFVMQGAGDVSATVDESAVQRLVRGIPAEEAMRRLESELVLTAPPTVELWPRFWPLMPALPLRISVEVEGQS